MLNTEARTPRRRSVVRTLTVISTILTLVAIGCLFQSYTHGLFWDIGDDGSTIGIESRLGRVEVLHTVDAVRGEGASIPPDEELPPATGDEAPLIEFDDLSGASFEELEDKLSPLGATAVALDSSAMVRWWHPRWFEYRYIDYAAYGMPDPVVTRIWAIPYWFIILLFAAWPCWRLIRWWLHSRADAPTTT